MRRRSALLLVIVVGLVTLRAQAPPAQPDWSKVEAETMQHFQALVRMDTSDPPGVEKPAADYLRQVLEREGIAVQVFATEPNRPNVVARLKGSGKKRPLLLMGHTDTVNVDPKKWTHPPFGADREGGFVYGRGTTDDKDNVAAGLMTLLLLERLDVPLDRDVIFLAEAGEEGTTRVGIGSMVQQHFADIDAEYCLAEGGSVTRIGGKVAYASIQTLEKNPRAIELTAHGVAGHGSVPLRTNPIAHLSAAIARIAAWKPPIRLNETTASYFRRLAAVSPPTEAARYLNILSADPRLVNAADEWFLDNEPRHASMIRTSLSPNLIEGGYRVNVIPSEARATLDVRLLPDEDADLLMEGLRRVIADPNIEATWATRDARPGGISRIATEAFRALEANVTKHYGTTTLPTMSTGATDMAYLRAKGVQCYGIGPATDVEDAPKGFGAHGDQERILEGELHRFVRFQYDTVVDLARAK